MAQRDPDDQQMPIPFPEPRRPGPRSSAGPLASASAARPPVSAAASPPAAAASQPAVLPRAPRPPDPGPAAPLASPGGAAKAPSLLRAVFRGAGFGALLLLVVWGSGQITMRLVQEKGKVDLPPVVGMESVAAIELLKERGLIPKIVTEEFNNRVGRGRIASQQPAGVMRVKPGAEVRLIVSRGPDSAAMPDLAGLPLPDAQRLMAEQGLRVGTVTEVHAEHHPPGVVIAHEPPAGESAKRGTAVHVLMNAGVSEEVGTMPNLVGQPVRGALARLQGMGVEARISFERAERLRDSILRQEPAAGGTLRRGQRVILVVGQ